MRIEQNISMLANSAHSRTRSMLVWGRTHSSVQAEQSSAAAGGHRNSEIAKIFADATDSPDYFKSLLTSRL
jgi:hypothetical protein